MKTSLLTLTLLIPSILSQCTIEKGRPFFRRSVYEFSIELVNRVAVEYDNHFVMSAFSPWSLISAVSLGATEETLDEIKTVLRLHHQKCFNNKFFEIIKDVTSASDGTVLERSSSLFVDDRMPLKEAFKNRVLKTEVSGIVALPFSNFEATAATINDYVIQKTHGTVDEIVSPSDLEGVYLVLLDALYFKGTWQYPFSPEETRTEAFYDGNSDENQIGDVNMMSARLNFKSPTLAQIQAKVLALPYGSNNRFNMLFFLPDVGVSVAAVLNNLRRISLTSIFTLLDQEEPTDTKIQIPRFKINSDLDNMKELLADMGLRSMFDMNSARFGDISDYYLYISNFIQKASIEVTEEGTEASAVSEASFSWRSYSEPNEFIANRPFLFMIVDTENEIPLFIGAYSNPSIF